MIANTNFNGLAKQLFFLPLQILEMHTDNLIRVKRRKVPQVEKEQIDQKLFSCFESFEKVSRPLNTDQHKEFYSCHRLKLFLMVCKKVTLLLKSYKGFFCYVFEQKLMENIM